MNPTEEVPMIEKDEKPTDENKPHDAEPLSGGGEQPPPPPGGG